VTVSCKAPESRPSHADPCICIRIRKVGDCIMGRWLTWLTFSNRKTKVFSHLVCVCPEIVPPICAENHASGASKGLATKLCPRQILVAVTNSCREYIRARDYCTIICAVVGLWEQLREYSPPPPERCILVLALFMRFTLSDFSTLESSLEFAVKRDQLICASLAKY
jgi:hypothetical protein